MTGTISAAVVAFVAAGCGGPLDTPDPRPPRDAGVDIRSGSGGHRAIDAAPDLVRDARVIPDAADAMAETRDSGVDAQWPVVPGCVTGQPPSPQFSPQTIPPINVSCASSSTFLTRLFDPAGQGLVYSAALNPPINGFSVLFGGNLCYFDQNSDVDLVVDQSATLPGKNFSTSLIVTVRGPPPVTSAVFSLQINTVAIDFDVNPAVLDFGVLTVGQFASMPVTVTNAKDSVPLFNIFPTQFTRGPFQLYQFAGTGQPLQPGDTQALLQAVIQASMPGTYDETFLVSAFPPGTNVDISCGVVRTITIHAQVVQLLPPG